VEIPDESVNSDSLELLWDLKYTARRNWKKREETFGRRILPENPIFLNDDPVNHNRRCEDES